MAGIMSIKEHEEYVKKKKKNQELTQNSFSGIKSIDNYQFTPTAKYQLEVQKSREKEAKKTLEKYIENENIGFNGFNTGYNRVDTRVTEDNIAERSRQSALNEITSPGIKFYNNIQNNFDTESYVDKMKTSDKKTNATQNNKILIPSANKTNFDNRFKDFDKKVKKYKDFYSSEPYRNYTDELYKTPLYQYYADVESVNNQEDFNFGEKAFNSFLGGLRSSLHMDQQYRMKDPNGKIVYVDLPNYQQIKTEKIMEKSGTLGKIYQQATASIGQMVPSIVAGAVTSGLGLGASVGSLSVMGFNSYLSGQNQALLDGYTDEQAQTYGLMNAGVELATEKMFDGLGGIFGKGSLDTLVTDKLTKNISNQVTKTLVTAGIDSLGEGVEEVTSDAIQPLIKQLALGSKEDYATLLKDEDLATDFFAGVLSSAILSSSKNIKDLNTAHKANILNKQNNINNNNNINLPVNNAVQSNNNTNQNELNSPMYSQNINSKNNIFSQQVDEVLNGTFNKENHMTVLDHTPEVLQNLGVKNLPITLTTSKLERIMNDSGNQKGEYHGLQNLVKKLPEAIQNPLDIIKSHNNSYVLTTDLSDAQDRSVIVSLKIDGKGYIDNIEIDTNVMTSAYGRNNYDNWMKKNLENGNIVYDIDRGYINNDNKKNTSIPRLQLPNNTSNFDITQGLQLPNDNIKFQSNNSTTNQQSQIAPLPINSNMQQNQNNTQQNIPSYKNINKVNMPPVENSQTINNKISNPNEISQLTKEDANTTPKLLVKNRNQSNDGESRFYENIRDKTNMLTDEQKGKILNSDEVKYYDKVTNKESLNKAFEKLEKNGLNESLKWFNKDSKEADSVDVAEGYILLKQYADNNDYDSMVEVAKKMRDIGTKAGQTVQAFNIMERLTPEGMVKYAQSELQEAWEKMRINKTQDWIDKYRKDFDLKPNEVQFIMDNMKEVSTMEDSYEKKVKLAEIQKIMTDKLPPLKGAGIKSWMRISMLFNPKTQVRNVVGNAIIIPVNSFGDLFASYADKIVAKKTGVRTTGKTNVKAMLKGMREGAYQATNDYKKGINTKDMQGNRFEITEGKNFNDKTLMGKSLNKVEGMLNYVMDAGDRVFSQAAFENSLQNQLVLNNTTEITSEMLDIARTESLQRTWNDNNNYTKFVLDVRRMMNKIHLPGVDSYGLGDVLIPFAKTPANLTKAIVDYSPVGLINTIVEGNNLRKSLTNGQFTASMQHKFVQDLGKATAGTMLYVLGYALAKSGVISGESDDDKDVSNFLKNTLGISSYSVKIGNKSFTYDWAQPIAAPLSIMANVVNSKNNKGQALTEAIVGSLDTAGSILLEQSFLQSINDVLNDNDGVVSGLINEMLELPSRAVPTFSKQIADMVDGTQRTSFEYGKPIQSAVNSFKAKIPFVSKSLAPTVDTMGREVKKYGGKNNLFNIFLNPANVNTENVSDSAKEIYRLYKQTGNTNIMPRVAPYYVNKKGEKITLDSEQRTEYQKTSGKIIEDGIKKLLKSKEYKNMSDDTKAEVINDIVNYSYNIAQKEVLGTELSQTYQKAYEYSKIGDIQDYYLFKNSIDDNNKKESISNFLIESNLNDKQLAYLYGNYYSSEEKLDTLVSLNIPIKQYIKLDSADIQGEYNSKTGQTISGSKKNAYIRYVNSLKLTVPQKATLIKMNYKSYDKYDTQIVNYVKDNISTTIDRKLALKQIGFDDFDKDIVSYIISNYSTEKERQEELKKLGFTIRNGRVYY